MASFYRSTVQEFLGQDEEQILARLGIAYANRGYTSQYTDQTLTWQRDLSSLRTSLEECVGKSDSARSWGLLLEFSVPRKEVRVDIVLLIRDAIVVLPFLVEPFRRAHVGRAAAHREAQRYDQK